MFVRQFFIGLATASLLALLITGIWHLTRMKSLTIVDVQVVGGETISHEEIKSLVNLELIGSYYKLVPKRFTYLYPNSTISKKIARIPRVKNVNIEISSRTTMIVTFEEYQAFALWCENLASKDCLFLDRFGYAFAVAPRLDGGAFLRYSSEDKPEVGRVLFDADYIQGTNSFVETTYNQLGLNIMQVKRELDDVTYYIAGGGEIRTTLGMSYLDTLKNLATILTSEEFSHLAPGNFRYVDLRFGNKVFVNEEMLRLASSTSATTSDADSIVIKKSEATTTTITH